MWLNEKKKKIRTNNTILQILIHNITLGHGVANNNTPIGIVNIEKLMFLSC